MAVCTSRREQFIAKQHEVEFTVELYLKLLEKERAFTCYEESLGNSDLMCVSILTEDEQ